MAENITSEEFKQKMSDLRHQAAIMAALADYLPDNYDTPEGFKKAWRVFMSYTYRNPWPDQISMQVYISNLKEI